MKKIEVLLLLLFCVVNSEENDFQVKGFDTLVVQGPFRTDIFQGDEEFLHISCEGEKCVDKFIVQLEDKILSIKVVEGITKLLNVRVKLGFSSLKKIVIGQTASVIAPYLTMPQEGDIELSSVATLQVGQIEATNLNLIIKDTSTVILQAGSVQYMDLTVQSVSNLKAANVQANKAVISASQISKVSLTCLQAVKAQAKQMSQIKIGGQPTIQRRSDALSKVILVHVE